MKLYNSLGPNPQVVRIFMAEKGIALDSEFVDVLTGENRQAAHLARNPHGQTPVLELDDGGFLSEITAICEFLEEKQPEPPLIGRTAEERAEARMWTRRVDLNICEPLTNSFRYSAGLKLFENRFLCLPDAADGLRAVAYERIRWLDGEMKGRRFLCGERFTLADIMLFVFLQFGIARNVPLQDGLEWIPGFLQRVGERPSAIA